MAKWYRTEGSIENHRGEDDRTFDSNVRRWEEALGEIPINGELHDGSRYTLASREFLIFLFRKKYIVSTA